MMKKSLAILAALLCLSSPSDAQTDSIVTIPMTYDRYLYLNPVMNDTVQGRFMFDTGAQLHLLDTAWTARNRLYFANMQTVTMIGTGNRKEKAGYITDTLMFRLGDHTYVSTPNVIALLSNRLPGIDGLTNITAFHDRIFTIDYESNTIRVLPRTALDTISDGRYQCFPFTLDNSNCLILPLTVVLDSARNQTISGQVLIDTGDPGSLTLRSSGTQLRHWKRKATNRYALSVPSLGIGGGGRVSIIRTQALSIGEAVIPAHEITIHEESRARDSSRIGAIGNALLSQFGTVVIDMREQNIYLPRGRQFRNKDCINYSGFRLSRIDRWFVNGVSYNAPAAVLNGDIVTHINGQSIDKLDEQQQNLYFCIPNRRYILTVIRDGLTLAIPVTNLNDETLWH